MISKEYGWTDDVILDLPYFRFCQIIETVNRRKLKEEKFDLVKKEVIAKFIASVFVSGSYLTKDGKQELLNKVGDFSLIDKKIKTEEKKLPKKGSFERLVQLFGGGRK